MNLEFKISHEGNGRLFFVNINQKSGILTINNSRIEMKGYLNVTGPQKIRGYEMLSFVYPSLDITIDKINQIRKLDLKIEENESTTSALHTIDLLFPNNTMLSNSNHYIS